MNFDNLKHLSREQLLEVAGKQGLQVHWKAKPETIIKQIMDKALNPQTSPVKKAEDPYHDKRLDSKPAIFNTEEQVEQAVAHIKQRKPEFTTTYNHEEHTVKFSYKSVSETVNLSVPLRWMKVRAEAVSQGAFRVMGLNEYFDKAVSSTYANNVLAG